MRLPRLVSLVCIATILALLAMFVVSAREMSLWAGLVRIADTGWGVTTLIDLYTGLFFVSIWIALIERRAVRFIPWIIALMLTGNFATLIYLAFRSWSCATLREIFIPSSPLPPTPPAPTPQPPRTAPPSPGAPR